MQVVGNSWTFWLQKKRYFIPRLQLHMNYEQENQARKRKTALRKGKPVPRILQMLFPNRGGHYIDNNDAP